MPSIFTLAFKPISGIAGGAVKLASAQPTSRAFGMAAAGGAAGAIGGAASGYDFNSRLEGAVKGAAVGAIGGAAGGAALHGGVWKAGIAGVKASGRFAKGSGLTKAGGGAAKMIGRAGMRAAEHPGIALGVAGAGMGAMSIANQASGNNQNFESPTLTGADMNVNYNQQAIASAELGQIGGGTVGTADQMLGRFQQASWMQQVGKMAMDTRGGRLAQSTAGLVQGLNAGRHG